MSSQYRKIVYVLGAGFSFGSGHSVPVGRGRLSMPLQQTLFEELCRYHYRRISELDKMAKVIRRYFNPQTYRTTRKGGAHRHSDLFGLSVEEIVTFLDEMSRSQGKEAEHFRSIAAQLQELTVKLISFVSSEGSPGRNPLIRNFVKRLAQTDSVITFNWDTLLDRTLFNAGKWHPSWGYGRSVRDLFDYQARAVAQPSKRYVRLLKLHGSINWLADATHREITRTFSPGSRYSDVVMMPPKMVKREIWGEEPSGVKPKPLRSNWAIHSERFYPKLWQEAEEQLAHARRIVFIGYSFPPADFSVSNMLRRAIGQAKASTGSYPAVDIVDPNSVDLARRFTQSFKIDFFNGRRLSSENTLYLSLESYLAGKRASS